MVDSAEQTLDGLSTDRERLLERLLRKEIRQAQSITPYPREPHTGPFRSPASWAQQRLWFIDQLEVESRAAYCIPLTLRLKGHLDRATLQRALAALVRRHEALRTVFVDEEGEPWQKIADNGRFALLAVDLSDREEEEREAQLRLHQLEEARGDFDLRVGPLIRGRLLCLHVDEHVLLVSMHHIISDGWSIGVLLRDLTELYAADREGRPATLAPLPIQYVDFSLWQRRSLRPEVLDRQLDYWRKRLNGAPAQLELPTDHPRPALRSYRGGSLELVIDAQLTTGLQALAQRHEMTLFMVVYTAWALLLSRLSGQQDILIGTPVAGRQQPEVEGLIGLFVNTIVLRVSVDAELSIKALLEHVKEVSVGAYDHQDTPFEKLVEALQPRRRLGHNPLFQVMFVLQNTPAGALHWPGLEVSVEPGVSHHPPFDLLLSLEERGDRLVGSLDYAADLYERGTLERWMAGLTGLLQALKDDVKGSVRDLLSPPQGEPREVILTDHVQPRPSVKSESPPPPLNGRRKRAGLLEPAPRTPMHEYAAPEGEVEEVLAGIWGSLLAVERVSRHDNFFDLDGHSLLALKLLFRINQSFGAALDVTDVYKSPTLRELASRICAGAVADELVNLAEEATLDAVIRSRSGSLGVSAESVLLTGGTGFVGRFLLAQLLEDTNATLYCLVRAPSAQQAASRLRSILSKWELWSDECERRIIAVPGDLRLPCFGLDRVAYAELCQRIDSIYHCATSMNHLETYAMAKPTNVEGIRSLLSLATEEKPKLLNYISTLSVFSSVGSGADRVLCEETPIDNERHPSSQGYSASKWVGEKIVMKASERGIPCNIFRLGLVWADTRKGRHDELQREYRVFKSCLLSGYGIKDYRYGTPPTPVDYVARSVVYLANQHCNGRGIFHIASSGQDVGGVFERCKALGNAPLELVSFYDWIAEIKRLHYAGRSLPAVPLIEPLFSLDEASLDAYERNLSSDQAHFDAARTHRELEQAGIVAPALNDDLLQVYLESLSSRDAELRFRQ